MKELHLTKGFVALVDDSDYEQLSRWKWTYSHGYALRHEKHNKKSIRIMLHRQIMGSPSNLDIDHRDGNGLNNQRNNLRVCTRTQNNANRKPYQSGKSSQFKGVSFRRDRLQNPWRATIGFNNERLSIGVFSTEVEAAKAYDERAKDLFGEFALINFP